MSDLISILSNAANSMSAQRALSSTAAHNIENVNTPGYSRQRAVIVAAMPAEVVGGMSIGRGSLLGGVTQARDRFVELQVPRVLGDSARSTAESDALQAVHALDPDRAGSLSSTIGGFYGSLQTLSQNPGDPGLRATALASAKTLATSFNRASAELAQQRAALDGSLQGYVDEVNAAARAVADANAAIGRVASAGTAPNDLLDLRQRSMDRLSELTGATPVPQGDGLVAMVLPGGSALVSGNRPATLSLEPDGANGGLASVRVAAPDGSSSVVPSGSFGGAIGGTLAARDGAMKRAADDVDHLAFDLASSLNAVHAANADLDGNVGQPLFGVGASFQGAASAMRLAISDPSQLATRGAATSGPGDPAGALALVATQRSPLATSRKDVQAALSSITSTFGAESQRASAYAEQDTGMKEQILAMRESVSGVSIDEELLEMQKAQRAFEAIARVIQVSSDMTKTLMDIR